MDNFQEKIIGDFVKQISPNKEEKNNNPGLQPINLEEGEITVNNDDYEKVKPEELLVPYEEYHQSVIKMDLFNMQFRTKLKACNHDDLKLLANIITTDKGEKENYLNVLNKDEFLFVARQTMVGLYMISTSDTDENDIAAHWIFPWSDEKWIESYNNKTLTNMDMQKNIFELQNCHDNLFKTPHYTFKNPSGIAYICGAILHNAKFDNILSLPADDFTRDGVRTQVVKVFGLVDIEEDFKKLETKHEKTDLQREETAPTSEKTDLQREEVKETDLQSEEVEPNQESQEVKELENKQQVKE